MSPRYSRRTLLSLAGAGVAAAAGCLGLGGSGDPGADGHDHDHEGEGDHTHDHGTDEAEETPDPELRIAEGRYLSSAFPIEFVAPDFEATEGFARETEAGREARITYVHWHGRDISHWHQGPLSIDAGGSRTGRTRFLAEGAAELPLGPDERFSQTVRAADGTPSEFVDATVEADIVELSADAAGEGEILFELWADDERRWISPPLPVEVA
jgi:hypothetical protein